MVRRDQVDHYKIVVSDEGAYDLDADGNRVRVPARSVLIEDLARPERWVSGGGFSYYLYIARDALDDLLPAPLCKHGEVLRTGTAGLLADHVRSLVRNLPQMTSDDLPDVVAATTRLIAACLAPSTRTVGEARPTLEATLLRQMCRYVELHLEDGALDAAAIGKAFRVSRSVLYRLFEPLGGVQSFIKERRLARAGAILAAATTPVHLGRLADRLAFKSAAHFSREFKARFGHAPSESAEHGPGPPGLPGHPRRWRAAVRPLAADGAWLIAGGLSAHLGRIDKNRDARITTNAPLLPSMTAFEHYSSEASWKTSPALLPPSLQPLPSGPRGPLWLPTNAPFARWSSSIAAACSRSSSATSAARATPRS